MQIPTTQLFLIVLKAIKTYLLILFILINGDPLSLTEMELWKFIIISDLLDNNAILMLLLYSKIFEHKAVNACDRIIIYLINKCY